MSFSFLLFSEFGQMHIKIPVVTEYKIQTQPGEKKKKKKVYPLYNLTRKSITYNYMLYKGVVVSKINNHYSVVYLGLTN